MKRIAVFASGGGTDFQSVIDANERERFCEIAVLVASKHGIGAIERAERHGIRAEVYARAEWPDLEELYADLAERGGEPFLVGDGAALAGEYLADRAAPHSLASGILLHQNAWGVCMAARGGEPGPAGGLLPVYLRLSQAERERQARLNNNAD